MSTFHERIKRSTDAAHAAAETAPFIKYLMGGELTKAAYRVYLVALLPIYERMESLFLQTGGVIAHFDHRALDRASAIRADIDALVSLTSQTTLGQGLSSVDRYLESLADDITPVRLLAHHYIRYLGDLSGGLAIAKLVARHYQIPSQALNFYDFTDIGDTVFYKKRYRDLLNLVNLNKEAEDEFLDEVSKLYTLSREIFIDLGQFHFPVAVA